MSSIRDSVLKDKNISITVSTKYLDHTDVFSLNFTAELAEYAGINDHLIKMTFQVVRQCSNIIYLQERW